MFELNEAPDIAIARIKHEKLKRCCGAFWGVALCIPTLGISIGCGDGGPNYTGFYPRPVTLESNAGLTSLIQTLERIKITPNKDIDLEDERKTIKWQVENTLGVLREALRQNVIQGSYRTVIDEAYRKILTRAQHDNSFSKFKSDKETAPLLTDHYVANYKIN